MTKRRYRRRRKNFLALPLLLLLCIFTYFFPEQAESILGIKKEQNTVGSAQFEVHFLDVGQGLSVLVRADEHAMLYDGGGRENSSYVVSYLQNQGIRSLDYVVASHYDADHISGLIGVLYNFNVAHVLGSDYEHDTSAFRSFMKAVTDTGLFVEHPSAGDRYVLGDAGFTVLAPDRLYENPNNNSIVIRLVNKNNSFLLSGDAEFESEDHMCSSRLTLPCDVICPAHHGSADATGRSLLRLTRPKYAVISCGAGNDYGHPHQELLQRLADAGVTVYRTDERGTIIARSDGDEIWWEL